MKTSTTNGRAASCSVCGTPLPQGVPQGLCPYCVLGDSSSFENPWSEADPPGDDAGTADGVGVGPKGRTLGDYELLEEIARGGMGVVYLARQRSLRRLVAVKVLLFGSHASAPFIRRFRIEAATAAALQHPNIVAIHEVGVHGDEHYLVMDYVEGTDLAQLVKDRPLAPQKAAQYLKTIAEAIHYAHENGVVHRDLKPSNVLIDLNGEPRVTDFGLAKRLGGDVQSCTDLTQLTLSGHLLGSPGYMPPEQAVGARDQLSRRSDVYALGAMLYHVLTGRPPFGGGSLADTLQQVRHQEPISLRLLNPGVPLDLETICLKCLEKEPDRRYPTARELSDELGRFLRQESIRARPIRRPERLWRWCRRRPAVAALVVALHVVFAAGLAGVLWQWRLAEQRAASERRERTRAERAERQAESEATRRGLEVQFVADMLRAVGPAMTQGRDRSLLSGIVDAMATELTTGMTDRPEVEADLRTILGSFYSDLGEYSKSGEMFARSLKLRQVLYGDNHPEVAQALHDLGYLRFKQGCWSDADGLLRVALASRRKWLGNDHPDVATSLVSLAELVRLQGNRVNRAGHDAEALLREALGIRQKLFGDESLQTAAVLSEMGLLFANQSNLDQAEAAHRQALQIRRRLLKPPNASIASSLASLGFVLCAEGRQIEAAELLTSALDMQRRLYGDEHPEIAETLANLAKAHRARGDLPQAEALFSQALAMRRKLLGPEHPVTGSSLTFLGFTLMEEGKPEAAEAAFREALEIQLRLSRWHEETAFSLEYVAQALAAQDRLPEAESLFRDALLIRSELPWGTDLLTRSVNQLNRVLEKQGKRPESLVTPTAEPERDPHNPPPSSLMRWVFR